MSSPTLDRPTLDRPTLDRPTLDPDPVRAAPAPASGSFAAAILEQAVRLSSEIVITDEQAAVTGREFARLTFRLARALARLGIGPGSRVALVAPARAETLAVRYACALVGAATVICPLPRLTEFVAGTGADVLVVFPSTASAAAPAMRAEPLRRVFGVGPVPGVDVDLLQAAADEAPDPVADQSRPDDLAVLVTSGGTTGRSKASRRSFASWRRMLAAPPDAGRRQLICTPLAYVGQVFADQTLLGGGRLVLQDRFEPADVLQVIEAERITHVGLVEPLLVELADHPDRAVRDLSSLVGISHIGAPAAANLRRRLLRQLGPVLVHPYGASEAGIVSVLAAPQYDLDHPDLLASAGRPLPGVRVRVQRADGTPAAVGEPGSLVIESERVADGYAVDPAESGFRADGYYPGDIGSVDAQGYVYVRGRAADARQLGGRAVFPVDVENALCTHPDVRYAAAVPTGTGFVAAVLTQPGSPVTATGLGAYARAVSGSHLVPERLRIVERVPVTPQGKPDRAEITRLVS